MLIVSGRRTDRPKDGRTNEAAYRVACKRLKSFIYLFVCIKISGNELFLSAGLVPCLTIFQEITFYRLVIRTFVATSCNKKSPQPHDLKWDKHAIKVSFEAASYVILGSMLRNGFQLVNVCLRSCIRRVFFHLVGSACIFTFIHTFLLSLHSNNIYLCKYHCVYLPSLFFFCT